MNGPAFITQVTQKLVKVMGTNWKLYYTHHSQSSGQIERKNPTLKETLTKPTLETSSDLVSFFPFALYHIHNSPYTLGLTPLEIMYVRPLPILPKLKIGLLAEFDDQKFLSFLQVPSQGKKQLWSQL